MNKKTLLWLFLMWAGFILIFYLLSPHKIDIQKEFDFESQPITITTYLYRTEQELRVHYPFPDRPGKLKGFATLYPVDMECEIHVLVDHELETTLGHELLHCLYGRWHKE